MKLISKLLWRLVAVDTPPEQLANTIFLRRGTHLEQLAEVLGKHHFRSTTEQASEVLYQASHFYLALVTFGVLGRLKPKSFQQQYSTRLIHQVRGHFSEAPVSDVVKQRFQGEGEFEQVFESDFAFYYHDRAPADEKEEFELFNQHFGTYQEDATPVGLMISKLQFRIAKILNLSDPESKPLIGALYAQHWPSAHTFLKELLRVKPVL